MVDFQTVIADVLKGRKASENNKPKVRANRKSKMREYIPFWYYHVYLQKTGPNNIGILPRQIAMKEPFSTPGVNDGAFATIAIDQRGRFGFVVCSEGDNYARVEGRRRALGKLMAAQGTAARCFGPTNFYHYAPYRLEHNVLRDAVGNALAKFLTDGVKKRS